MEEIHGKRKHGHEQGLMEDRKLKYARHNESREYQNGTRAERHEVSSTTVNGKGHPKASKSEQISKLLASLDELLQGNDENETRDILGSGMFDQCSALRRNLESLNSRGSNVSQNRPASNIPVSISHLLVAPWTASAIPKTLPPLPEVLDPTLKTGAFIHQGTTSGNARDLSYEKLEWVGDAYLYITATLLISQTFPALLPGKCSQLRERIVKNVQLAEYARHYGFDEKAKLPEGTQIKESERTKMLGDIFEAYIAAIILSDPVDGVAKCTEWLKALWSMTLEKDIRAVERDVKLDSPMWRLRGGEQPVQLTAPKYETLLPAKDRLRKLICSPGVELTYRSCAPDRKDPSNKLPVFTVGVFLTGWGEKDRKLGVGKAHGKKDAGQKAAEIALANTKLMSTYAEKKKLFDAQKELERQALESIG